MTFWSGETLAQRLPTLISGFDPKQIDCAAYTLHVGSEAYVSPTSDDSNTKTKFQLHAGQSFAIPPGQFAFLLTHEKVTVPPDAIAFISMKARKKFRGLVNVSGFHVDPGYDAKLIFSVFNAGPAPIHLQEGEDCFLIWYASLSTPDGQPSKYVRTKGGFDTIPTDLINPIAGQILSFEGLLNKIKDGDKQLDDRIRKIERDHSFIRWAVRILFALVIGLVGWFLRDWIAPWFFNGAVGVAGQTVPASPDVPSRTDVPPASEDNLPKTSTDKLPPDK